jgi:hypothetical protein
MVAHAKIWEKSGEEGTGKTTVDHTDVDTHPGSGPPDHRHIDYDLSHQAQLQEIASLFEDIQSDIRVITDRFDDESKGCYVRQADTVAPNPANIAAAAQMADSLARSGLLDQINAEIANPTDFSNTSPANYAGVRNSTSSPGGFVGGSAAGSSQTPGYGGAATVTTADGEVVAVNDAPYADIVPAAGEATGNVRYGNQGTKRSLPIQQALMDIIDTAAKAAGVDALITSGGQVPASEGGVNGVNRTGSNRHDKGYGADVALYTPDFNGRRLDSNNADDFPIIIKFMEACRDAGATAIGQGNGYMSDRNIHVDIAWIGQQSGAISGILSNRYWGGGSARGLATNTANTPRYLRELMTPRDNA